MKIAAEIDPCGTSQNLENSAFSVKPLYIMQHRSCAQGTSRELLAHTL